MVDIPQPPSIFRDLAGLERRLKNQESANRQAGGGITGGALKVYSLSGGVLAYLGQINASVTGLQVTHPSGASMLHISDAYGWAQPYLTSSWTKPSDYNSAATTTFEDMYRVRLEQATGLHVRFQLYFSTPAGTTGEVRVMLNAVALGPVYAVPSAHSAWHEFAFPLGATLYAGPFELQLQARITGGTGALQVWRPYDAAQGYYTGVIPVTGWIT